MSKQARDVAELYRAMLKAQQDSGGFDLSFRELMDVWQLRSTSAVSYCLMRLLECDLVTFKDHGRRKVYRAVEAAETVTE